MTNQTFWRLLGLTTAASAIALFLLHALIPALSSVWFSIATVVLFIVISGMVFYLGKRTATSPNRFRFVHVILLFILIKMVASLVLVVVFVDLVRPTGKVFVVPFLVVYLFYTIFEVYFLEKIARLKPVEKTSSS